MLSLDLSEFVDSTQPTVADSTVDQDFAPTRDRSERSTSVFSYKSVRDENDATPFARGGLEPHVPSLFGEIDRVAVGGSVYLLVFWLTA